MERLDSATMKTKIEIAREVLAELFARHDRVVISHAKEAAAQRGVSSRTLTRAAKELGVAVIYNGPYGHQWERKP